jgi:hypothetical protein
MKGSLMKGGENSFNFGQKQADYMKTNINAYIKQKQSKTKLDDVQLLKTSLKINKMDTMKKGLFFKTQPQINPYTDYFEKEGMFLFIDWVRNSVKDVNTDIYVIAHSNIMQATLVNICQLIKNNPSIDKKTLDMCHPAFSTIKHQNIWEMMLYTSTLPDGSMFLDSMTVREGEDPPNVESTNAIDLNQELSCFSKEPMPIKNNNVGTSILVPDIDAFSLAKSAVRPYGGKKKKTKRRTHRNKNTRKRRC